MLDNAMPPTRGKSVILGAFGGFVAALILISLGMVKFLILRHRGAPLRDLSSEDVRVLLFYVGALILAGAFVGAFRPILSSRRKMYGAFAGAGAIVMNSLALSDGIASMDLFSVVLFSVLGAIVGLATAFAVRLGS
jgi:hypothetical protein